MAGSRQKRKTKKKKDGWELRPKPDKNNSSTDVRLRTMMGFITLPPQRQSVTLPGELAQLISASASQQHKSFSKAIVDYARLGILEEQRGKQRLLTVVNKIRNAASEEEASRYEDELVEAIFGPQQPTRA